MNSPADFQQLKIGCVQYLNAKPLIYDCNAEIEFDHPSKLAQKLASGLLDVALVPVFELFENPDYKIVDGISISSHGEVFSVFLAYHGDLNKVKQVSLDVSSLTSANLLRCLLAEFHDLHPDYVRSDECDDPDTAKLLIGNQAIEFRRANGSAFHYLDLGAEWTQRTAQPFVYALWLVRPDISNPQFVADELRRIKARGLAHLDEIIRDENEADFAFRAQYLRHHIRYDLGESEKAGMRKFHELLLKHGLLRRRDCYFNFV